MDTATVTQIYRYKLDINIINIISSFAKQNQHALQKDYKEEWKKFIEENKEIIMREETRLKELGYQGDVIEKMYKSGRYYFKNKNPDKIDIKKARKKYERINNDIRKAIKEHVNECIKNKIKPADAYENFINENLSYKNNISIKKAYKNIYYNYQTINI